MKKYVNVGLNPDQLEFLEGRVKSGKSASVSHAIRQAVQKLMDIEKEES